MEQICALECVSVQRSFLSLSLPNVQFSLDSVQAVVITFHARGNNGKVTTTTAAAAAAPAPATKTTTTSQKGLQSTRSISETHLQCHRMHLVRCGEGRARYVCAMYAIEDFKATWSPSRTEKIARIQLRGRRANTIKRCYRATSQPEHCQCFDAI